jgi:regulator of RNase E activity RraA
LLLLNEKQEVKLAARKELDSVEKLRIFEMIREFDSPTVSNAIESFNVRGKAQGIISPQVKEILGYGRPFIGYACTGKIMARDPVPKDFVTDFEAYYSSIEKVQGPVISVIEDLDEEPIGSFWGEVNAHIHRSLGAVAVVTNGGVRDIEEVRPIGFGFYASCKMVSHANIRLVDFDCSVNIFGTKIYPGDIIFCDQYGALIIPEGTLYYLVEACRKIAAAELPVIQNCKAVILNGKKAKAQDLVLWRKQMEQLRLELKEEIKSLN